MKQTNTKETFEIVMDRLKKEVKLMEKSNKPITFFNIRVSEAEKFTNKTNEYFKNNILQPILNIFIKKGYYCYFVLCKDVYTVYIAKEEYYILLMLLADKLLNSGIITEELYIPLRGLIFKDSDKTIKENMREYNEMFGKDSNEEDKK